jgi:hypothetical protein
MCRRCGEPDRRGPAKARRRRRDLLLNGMNGLGGNGTVTVCVHCHVLLGAVADTLTITDPARPFRPIGLEIRKLEQDRILGLGTPYNHSNVQPACGPCNRARTYEQAEIPEGCQFGPELAEAVA